jgi:transcriptional regulator with XRE-family HTH domain
MRDMGITQSMLAERVGESQGNISGWLSTNRYTTKRLNLERAEMIANALGHDLVDYLKLI